MIVYAVAISVLAPGSAHALASPQTEATVQRSLQAGDAPPPSVAFGLYKAQMIDLQRKAVAQRKRDGGKLTPEHDAAIQREIDRITQLYHRRLQGLGA